MFGIVIFYPAGQPIRNRSGAEKCRLHGCPASPHFTCPEYVRSPWGGANNVSGTQKEGHDFRHVLLFVMLYHCRFLNPQFKNAMCKSEFFVLF